MIKLLAFNLNDYVLVKVLPKGFEAMRAYYGYMPAEWQKPVEHYQALARPDGYCKFQLWEFMQIFGPSITLATTGLFETQILFDSKDLSSSRP